MNYFNRNDPSTSKDFSDWRNIQLGPSPGNFFDPMWMPTTTAPPVHPWNPPPPPHPWAMPTYPLLNFNPFPTPEPINHVIDLTTNSPRKFVLSRQLTVHFIDRFSSDFIPIQPTTETDLVLMPEIDVEAILGHVEAVIPDIDLESARRTINGMTPIPSTNDIVTHFLDNGYTKKSKKPCLNPDATRPQSLKRSLSDILDDIPKFLTSYPDPISYFFDTQRKQSESYVNHSKAFLLRAFPTTETSILEQALQEENCHFLPTVRKLETRMGLRTNAFLQRSTIRKSLEMLGKISFIDRSIREKKSQSRSDLSTGGVGRMPSAAWLMKNNKFIYAIPHTPCEEFYDELRYAKNEVKIRRKNRNDSFQINESLCFF